MYVVILGFEYFYKENSRLKKHIINVPKHTFVKQKEDYLFIVYALNQQKAINKIKKFFNK